MSKIEGEAKSVAMLEVLIYERRLKCVAQINVDRGRSRREKCNVAQILKEDLHQKRR